MVEVAEVPLYPALIKTTRKWDWLASDLEKWAALVNAEKGISPFVLIDLSEEDIALTIQNYEDLHCAMTVSAT